MSAYLGDLVRQVTQDMFNKRNARLPEHEQCALYLNKPMCDAEDDGYGCTAALEHAGDHVAHNPLGEIVHRWQP